MRAADRKLLLRSVARYDNPGSIEEILVAPSVRLGDIATIRYEEPDRDFMVRVNSRPAYALMVMKEAEANALEVARRVRTLRDEFQTNPRLAGVQVDLIMDQGEIILTALSTLLSSGRVGAMFAVVVLFFFLRRFRLSLIIGLSIPLSMVVALVVMYFAGETLNILSLLGLMISVGLLVDNAVVVAENIHRLHREGVARREACIRGAGEIAMAITTATLTTVVVFLPVSLVEGQGQFFLLRLAIPISVSLLASLLVALIVIPLAVYLTLPGEGREPRLDSAVSRLRSRFVSWLRVLYEASIGALSRLYARLLDLCLTRRLETVFVIVVLVFGTQWFARDRLEVVPMSDEDQAFWEIDVDLPDNLTFEEGQAWFLAAERELERLAREEFDLEFYMVFQNKGWGEVQGAISPEEKTPPREITARVLEVLPELPGIEFETGMQSETGDEDEKTTHTVTLFGEDPDLLATTAHDLRSVFEQVEGVIGQKGTGQDDPDELALFIDRDRARARGVNPQTLAGIVSSALRGRPLPRVYYGGRDIPVRVRYEEEDRQGLAELGGFSVPTETGAVLPLSALVDVQQMASATRIRRRNKQTAQTLVLELAPGEEKATRARIENVAKGIDLPEGVAFGERLRFSGFEEMGNITFAIALSIVFVYLLMGFLFESFLLPLAILITIPLANIGVTWIHLLAGRDIDFLGLVGSIILIGVVVNNGIVLLDYVRRLGELEGLPRGEAVRVAAQRRFRPILMTALTTICGMVPLLFGGATRMGLSYTSFALTLIGGMVTASLLTLLVVPVIYTLFEDARALARRAFLGVLLSERKVLRPS